MVTALYLGIATMVVIVMILAGEILQPVWTRRLSLLLLAGFVMALGLYFLKGTPGTLDHPLQDRKDKIRQMLNLPGK